MSILSGVWAGSRNCGFTALIAYYWTWNDQHQHWHCSRLWWRAIYLCPFKNIYIVMANNKRGNLLLSLVSYWSNRSQHMTGCKCSQCAARLLCRLTVYPTLSVLCLGCSSRGEGVGGGVWPEFSSPVLPGLFHTAHRRAGSTESRGIAANLRQQWVETPYTWQHIWSV